MHCSITRCIRRRQQGDLAKTAAKSGSIQQEKQFFTSKSGAADAFCSSTNMQALSSKVREGVPVPLRFAVARPSSWEAPHPTPNIASHSMITQRLVILP